MGFSVLLILQWALGFYSEWFGALFGVVPRTVIEIHKVLGWILFWCAVILSIEKFLISRLKIRRAPIYDSCASDGSSLLLPPSFPPLHFLPSFSLTLPFPRRRSAFPQGHGAWFVIIGSSCSWVSPCNSRRRSTWVESPKSWAWRKVS